MAADDASRDVGWPCGFDLATPDPDAARRFYSELFGWNSYTLAVPGWRDYDIFTLGDVQGPEVGGMQPLADDTQPPSWTCYFRVDDLQARVETVKAEGGQELIPPTGYAGIITMALCTDPEGADFGLALPNTVIGFSLRNEPGAMCWVELACRDVPKARHFYGKVFGWRSVDHEYHGHSYCNFKVGDRSIGGVVRMDERWPRDYPAHWIPYFRVEDCDATAARAADLGARIRIPPADLPSGRYAMMTDLTGARLAVITPWR
jgi:predicted enzyme related to lactoylglutathione lyase